MRLRAAPRSTDSSNATSRSGDRPRRYIIDHTAKRLPRSRSNPSRPALARCRLRPRVGLLGRNRSRRSIALAGHRAAQAFLLGWGAWVRGTVAVPLAFRLVMVDRAAEIAPVCPQPEVRPLASGLCLCLQSLGRFPGADTEAGSHSARLPSGDRAERSRPGVGCSSASEVTFFLLHRGEALRFLMPKFNAKRRLSVEKRRNPSV